jgi:hypothetical protein
MAEVPQSKLGELTKAAERALAQLLEFDGLKRDQWLVRVSVPGETCGWEALAADTDTNDRMIRERIARSPGPVSELAVGYVGMIDWRGAKHLMAYVQFFQSECAQGLLCLRQVQAVSQPGTFQGLGGFLIAGVCKNIWL